MNKNIMFYDNIGNVNTYDLITCISVLCRWLDSSEYTFELFEKTIQQIDNLLVVVNNVNNSYNWFLI